MSMSISSSWYQRCTKPSGTCSSPSSLESVRDARPKTASMSRLPNSVMTCWFHVVQLGYSSPARYWTSGLNWHAFRVIMTMFQPWRSVMVFIASNQ